MRKFIGRIIEWFLHYDHEVIVKEDWKKPKLPFRSYKGDAGYDLFCSKKTTIKAGGSALIPSGISIDPKERIWFHLGPRSSTFRNLGLEVVTAVIDNDYRGELFAQVINPSNEDVTVHRGSRIVQIIPHRLIPIRFKHGELSESPRAEKGFGSSGL